MDSDYLFLYTPTSNVNEFKKLLESPMKDSTFIILPAFNEAEVISRTLSPLLEKGYQVVVVDDGSHDDTRAIVKDMPIHFLKHSENMGQGAALQTGMDFALAQGGECFVHFDADGQHNADEIPPMLELLSQDKADVIIGSRFLRKEDQQAIPMIRRLQLRIGILVNRAFTGLKLTDAHNGFRAFNRKAAQKVRITENRMAHATEILRLIKLHKLRYLEIPTHIRYTKYSIEKGQTSFSAIKIFLDIVRWKFFK